MRWDLKNKENFNAVKKTGLGKMNKEARRIKASRSMNKVCSGQNLGRRNRRQGWKELLTTENLECYSRVHVGHSGHLNSI